MLLSEQWLQKDNNKNAHRKEDDLKMKAIWKMKRASKMRTPLKNRRCHREESTQLQLLQPLSSLFGKVCLYKFITYLGGLYYIIYFYSLFGFIFSSDIIFKKLYWTWKFYFDRAHPQLVIINFQLQHLSKCRLYTCTKWSADYTTHVGTLVFY